MYQYLKLMEFIGRELNVDNTELNAYVKGVALYNDHTIVVIEFLPEGILPSGCYKLLSNFLCYNEDMQGATISHSNYTDKGTLHGLAIRLPETIPSYYEVYDQEGVKL